MPRGYRCVILAAFGWLILAAGPKPEAKPEQPQPTATVSRDAQTVANAITSAAQTGDYQQPCRDKQDKGSEKSDLCAQWTAANAAVEAAYWTKISAFLTAASLIGLAITIRLTLRALDADNRPWVHLEKLAVDSLYTGGDNDFAAFSFTGELVNIGKTAAANVKIRLGVRGDHLDAAALTFSRGALATVYVDNVLPGVPRPFDILSVISLDEAVGQSGECQAAVIISYTSPGRGKVRYLRQVWTIAKAIYKGTPETLDREALVEGGHFKPATRLMATTQIT